MCKSIQNCFTISSSWDDTGASEMSSSVMSDPVWRRQKLSNDLAKAFRAHGQISAEVRG